MTKELRTLIFSFLASCLLVFAGVSAAIAADNPFALTGKSIAAQVEIASSHGGGKCGAGKCGGKSTDASAEVRSMCADKIRNGFCGAGKCGAGKCGGSLKETCAKMIEGKPAEGKCGGSGGKCGSSGGKCGAGKCGGNKG